MYYVDLGGIAEIHIVPDPGGVTDGIRASGFRFPMLFRYEWLSKQRVRKAYRITSLTVVVLACQNYLINLFENILIGFLFSPHPCSTSSLILFVLASSLLPIFQSVRLLRG